jgi:glycosyltransferase involved in cell wall biosynthesis
MMKVLYLYAEVMGYTMATIRALTELGCEVHVVHSDRQKKTPYKANELPGVFAYPRSQMDLQSLETLVSKFSFDITVVSGWQDQTYLQVARHLRRQGKLVVVGLDSQWHGSVKQRVAATLGSCGIFKRWFSHAWVAGLYQYEYARQLGFDKTEITFDLYSADLGTFLSVYEQIALRNRSEIPHQFLYVGRFESIKGLDTLLVAWESLFDVRQDWQLHLIGCGSLKERLSTSPGIVVKDFMQPVELASQICNAGCFVMPSRGEPWGVVLHEMAAAGLPLIVSDVVGAATAFLIPGLNGFVFDSEDAAKLAQAMKRFICLDPKVQFEMGQASHQLAMRITPMTSAHNLLSILMR